MANIDLNNIQFPIKRCTSEEYSALDIKEADIVYIITDVTDTNPRMFLNDAPIANVVSSGVVGATIDDTETVVDKTWSSQKVSDKIDDVKFLSDNINIAQKTVNKRGYVDLLSEEVLIPVLNAKTLGTAVATQVNLIIELTDSIENYDFLNFEFGIKSSERVYKGNSSIINTSNIAYNNSDELISTDGSVFWLMFEVDTFTAGSFGTIHHMLKCWFKDGRHLVVYQAFNPQSLDIFNTYAINSIKGVKLDSVTIDPVEYVMDQNTIL